MHHKVWLEPSGEEPAEAKSAIEIEGGMNERPSVTHNLTYKSV